MVGRSGSVAAKGRARSGPRPFKLLLLLLGLAVLAGGPGSGILRSAPDPTPTAQPDPSGAVQEHTTPQATTEAHSEAGDEAHAEGEEGHGPRIRDVFFVLIAILVGAKVLGELAERRGQPAVLGELVAGVILGASVLGVIPASGDLYEIVHVLAEIGVVLLLFEIGLETDLKEMFRVGPTAARVALIGVFLPFLLGFLYWYYANPSIGVHPEGITFTVVAIFVGATLTATSVGITARVLSDLNRMHTPEARIIIGAAVIDDVLGIVILAVVSGMVGGAALGVLSVGKIFLFAVGFLVLAVVLGTRFAPTIFDFVDRMRTRGVLLVAAFCFALAIAALADLAGERASVHSGQRGLRSRGALRRPDPDGGRDHRQTGIGLRGHPV